MRAGLLGIAVILAGCAGAATPPGGSWLHPSFSAGQLQSETVVVLPVGEVALPAGVLDDSVAAALALRAGDTFATALQSGGAAGLAVRPAVAVAALATLSADEIATLYAPLGPALLDASLGGELPPAAAAAWSAAAERAEERYFLVPRALTFDRLEPLRVRADLDAWLVDAPAGRVLWHADLSAVNPHAPSGAAEDVYRAALEDAVEALAQTLTKRLSRLARTGADDFEALTP